MEELKEAPFASSKMDHHEETLELLDDTDGCMVNMKLPEQLQKISPSEEFVSVRHRWNTNEEIASILIAFDHHKEWLVLPQKIRPPSGSMLLYNRKVVFYRRDGYCWKKRRNGSTIREDHMKLKVQGLECIYGSYVHSAILPTFHRRCYWLLQNPNIVLIHYLNVPYPEAAKPPIPSLSYELSQKTWSKEELVDQLRPMLSRAAQGTEHDAEDDQKVEKMLDEILPLLMPMHESTKPLAARPLAPAPNCSPSSPSYMSSKATTTSAVSLKRPIRNHTSTTQPPTRVIVHSGQPETQLHHSLCQMPEPNNHVPAKITTVQPPMISAQTISNHPHKHQKAHVQIPVLHSLTQPGIQNQHGESTTVSSSTQSFNTINLSGGGQNINLNGHIGQRESTSTNSANYLNQTSMNSASTRYVTVGNGILSNLTMATCENHSSVTEASSPILYSASGTSASNCTSASQNSYLSNTPTSASGHEKGILPSTSSSSMTINQYLQNQESRQNNLLQQIPYQAIAQQNHSFVQNQIDPQQQIKLQQQTAPPLLTVHLTPAIDSSSEVPGFVLSLQGATIVSQNADQHSPGYFDSTRAAQSVNLSTNQGLVLVASQGPGGLVLNRISPQPQPQSPSPTNSFASPQGSPPDKTTSAQNLLASPFSHHNDQHISSPQITGSASIGTGPAFTQSHNRASPAQPFYPVDSVRGHSLSEDPHHKFSNLFPTSSSTVNAFPIKLDSLFHTNTNNVTCRGAFSVIKKEESQNETTGLHPMSYSGISTFGSTNLANETSNPVFTWALAKNIAEPSSSISAQHPSSQSQLQQQRQLHEQEHLTSELMVGPSGLKISVKDMITSSGSCDTLDGSFSSLPSADLNLDDLLDLNDLDDVSDLGYSPFTSAVLSEQPINNADMTVEKDYDHNDEAGMRLMAQDQGSSSMNGETSCPMSTSFSTILGNPTPGDPLVCDNPDLLGGHGEPDPELNSVIKDFSPDWAYTKTNTKILVAGPWCSRDCHYSCVFDGEHVSASLLQPGLLRCFTQYHRPGYVTLQVARNGMIISNCEVFEFCERETRDSSTTHPEWFSIDSNQLKLLLIERLDQLRRHFVRALPPLQDCISDDAEFLERNLVRQVQLMMGQPWTNSNLYPKAGPHNLTLLHLAASLGFAKLVSCLIRWRMDSNSVALEFEVDAQSVDSHACTPLMWACALGKIDAALTLYHWNTSPLKMCNKDGHLPLTLARQKGFFNLANQVEQLERAKGEQQIKEQQHKESTSAHDMDLTFSPLTHINVHNCTDLTAGPSSDQGKDDSELKDSLIEIRITPPSAFPKPVKPGPKLIRRFSEQVIGHQNRTLSKRNSVDILPSGQDVDQVTLPSIGSPMAQPVCESNSEPQLSVSPDMAFVAPPAPRLLLEDEIDEPSVYSGEASTSKMDTDEIVSAPSPIIDVERISSDEEVDANKDGTKHQMVTLANQIIAAMPERIKLSPSKADDGDDVSSSRVRSESHSSLPSQGSPRPSSFGDDSGISTPMTDSLAFEEYRYPDFGTPASSLSPDSTCLPSPYSPYSFTLDSPPPTTAEFTEYFNAPTTYMEKDFSQLTLSDQEQRKLYEAAKVIQNAYRHYRDKQQQQQQLQQQKEIEAAILIQSYYRRYKTYAYYKKMSHAAVLIQNQFRTYYAKRKKWGDTGATARRELERLKKGRNQSVIIQQRFRSHYQRRSLDGKDESGLAPGTSDAPDSSPPPQQETSSQIQEGTPPVDADAAKPPPQHSDEGEANTDGSMSNQTDTESNKVMDTSATERSPESVTPRVDPFINGSGVVGCCDQEDESDSSHNCARGSEDSNLTCME